MTNMTENFQSEIEKQTAAKKQHYKNEILKTIYLSIYSSSEIVDRASTWLLTMSTAILGLFVSNIGGLSKVYDLILIRHLVVILTFTCLLGVVAKILFYIIKTNIDVSENIDKSLSRLAQKHTKEENKLKEISRKNGIKINIDVNFTEASREFLDSLPYFAQKRFLKYSKNQKTDNLWAYKRASKLFIWQDSIVLIQIGMFFFFVLFVIINI